jgi:DNA-binding XRE family transcriptional regulator
MTERKIYQSKMASDIGESDFAISRLLKGTQNPRLILIYKIAKYLCVTVEDLVVEKA